MFVPIDTSKLTSLAYSQDIKHLIDLAIQEITDLHLRGLRSSSMEAEILELAESQAELCKALGNTTRVLILWALTRQEMPVTEIASTVGASLPNTSQHLRLMKDKGILASRREGSTVYYRLKSNGLLDRCPLQSWCNGDNLRSGDQANSLQEHHPTSPDPSYPEVSSTSVKGETMEEMTATLPGMIVTTPGFSRRVMEATPGGETLRSCLQCGTCGGSCPSADDMQHTPRQLFAMVNADMRDDVLRSNTPWYCVSCYYCTVRCPQEIPITDIMYSLKQMAVAEGLYEDRDAPDWSNSFIGYVEQYGRSYELGLATRYHLTHKPLGSTIGKSTLGLRLIQKGRLSITPERIRNVDQLTSILNEAKRIAAQEM